MSIEKGNKFEGTFISRRLFNKLLFISALDLAMILVGCSLSRTRLTGDLKDIAKGFDVYNKENPNLRYPHKTKQSWYSNIYQRRGHSVDLQWGGTQYSLPNNTPIVASASGKVSGVGNEHHELYLIPESVVSINHGIISTHYIHMKKGSSRHLKYGQKVKRGDIIGRADNTPSLYVKFYLQRHQFPKEDPDNYGRAMGYMNYWDGQSNLDLEPNEINKRADMQLRLIFKFADLYDGPDSNKIPVSLTHKGGDSWSFIEIFKLMKFIYDRHPEYFRGKKKDIDILIAEIYRNQPIILTLPLIKL